MKKYKAGLFIGRMQHIHNLHERLIRRGLEQCDKLLVYVGCAQLGVTEPLTERNPFPAEARMWLINTIFKQEIEEGRLVVAALNDMTDEEDSCAEWGRYLLDHAEKDLGLKIDYMVSGDDESRELWFSPEDMATIFIDKVERQEASISATELRGYITNRDRENWQKHVNPILYPLFDAICLAMSMWTLINSLKENDYTKLP